MLIDLLTDDKRGPPRSLRQGLQRALEILPLARSFKVHLFSKSHSCYKTDEREFPNCSCHPVGPSIAGIALPPLSQCCLLQGLQSPHKRLYYLPGPAALTGPHPADPGGEAVPGKLALISFTLAFSSLIPLFLASFPDSFLTAYLPTTLSLALLCLKTRDYKGKGKKWAQTLGGQASKALERETGRIFSSLSHNSLQNTRPLFSVTMSTYLVPWIDQFSQRIVSALGVRLSGVFTSLWDVQCPCCSLFVYFVHSFIKYYRYLLHAQHMVSAQQIFTQ